MKPEKESTLFGVALTSRQAQVIARSMVLLAWAVIACAVFLVIRLGISGLGVVRHVIGPVLLAQLLAILLKPWYSRIHKWTREKSVTLSFSICLTTVLLPFALAMTFMGALLVNSVVQLIDMFPEIIERAMNSMPRVQAFLARTGLLDVIRANLDPKLFFTRNMALKTFAIGGMVMNQIVVLVCWAVTPVYLFYFLTREEMKGRAFTSHLPFLSEKVSREVGSIIDEFRTILSNFFCGQFMVVFLECWLYGAGFWAVGLEYGFGLGMILSFLNLIPYFGNIVGMSLALALAFFGVGGSWSVVAGVCIVFVFMQMLDGYFIMPRIMGKRTNLSPVMVIFGIFFWTTVFGGFIGLFLAVPLTAFLKVLWPRLIRYSRRVAATWNDE